MSIARQVRRIAAAPRPTARPSALRQLATLLQHGQAGGPDHLALCQELGLVQRASAAIEVASPAQVSPAVRIRQAVLAGETAKAVELGTTLASAGSPQSLTPADWQAVVRAIAPLSADTALMLVRASDRASAMEPALLLQRGDREAAAARLEQLATLLGPQRWLLQANLRSDPAGKLDALNRCLGDLGLAPVRQRDPTGPLCVANLARTGSAAPTGDAAAPLLSVVMTCYDSAAHLDAALQSVFGQDHAHLELIAVDDGSRDDTWSRLQDAARREPRLHAVRLRQNVGTYAAKNVGLALARGEYLAFQDADDWSHPQRFSRCVQDLQARPALMAVTALYVRLQDDGVFWSSKVWPLLRWTPNSIVFRRASVAREIGAFDEHRFGADSEYVARVRLAFGDEAVRRLDLPLIIAARRDNSLMTARSTGLDAQGRSQARADYQEAWTEELLQRVRTGASLRREPGSGTEALIAEATGAGR